LNPGLCVQIVHTKLA